MSASRATVVGRTAWFIVWALLLLFGWTGEHAGAQTTSGTLRGQVLDAAGKGLPNAKVVATNEENGNDHARVTNNDGQYEFFNLQPAAYRITASLEGYQDGTVPNFVVPLNVITPLRPPDITLVPLAVATAPRAGVGSAQPPNPQEGVPTINTSDATRRGNFVRGQLESLPLGGMSDMRTFDELAFLSPGVAPPPYTPGVRGPGIGFGIGSAGEFSVNGMRARSNSFTVDGSDNNDPDVGVRRQGFVALVPQSIESINQFEMSTLLWDAELGRNFGSQVNVVSQDGGSQYHGEAYGFLTDSLLNARNFFDYTDGPSHKKDAFTRSQTGFVVGGPLLGARTQFFSSFEHLAIHSSSELHFATPTESQSRFLDLARFSVLTPNLPLGNSFQFFNTKTGATPLGQNILSLYPVPNDPGGPYGSNTFTEAIPDNGRGDVFSAKVASQFTDKNEVFVRYNFTDDERVLPSINRAIDSTTGASTRTQDLSLIANSQIGGSFSNSGRFSYGRTRLRFSDFSGSPLLFSSESRFSVDTNGVERILKSKTSPLGELLIEPFSPVGVDVFTFPQARVNNTFQYADTLSRKIGAHSIKAGADIRRVQLNSLVDRNFRPQVVYGYGLLTSGTLGPSLDPSNPFEFRSSSSQLITGVQLATLGLPSSIFQTITAGVPDSTIGLRFTEYNFFFNDNWRASKNLTLDYGLRYEYNSVPREASNRIEDALKLKDLPVSGSSSADSKDRTDAFNAAVVAYENILAGRTAIYNPDHNNLGPHAGFAWDPWSDGRTSIRGGYGIYYDAILGAVVSQSRNVFPTEIPINVNPSFTRFDVFSLNTPSTLEIPSARKNAPAIPLIAPGTVNQLGGASSDFVAVIGQLFSQNKGGGGLAFTLPEKSLRTPYAQQWHLTIERQIHGDFAISAAYVGSKGTKLTRLTTPNLGPNTTPSVLVDSKFTFGGAIPPIAVVAADCRLQKGGNCDIQPVRPELALGAYEVFSNSASSTYHSFQLEGRKRYSRRYSVTVSYTWSHAIDDVSDLFPIAGAPVLPQDSFNLRAERGSANFDIRHRFAGSLIWDLPFYEGSAGMAARFLGGWQIASILQANTGQPFTLNIPVDANFDGNLTDRPSTTNGLVFSDGHRRQRLTVSPGAALASFFVLGQDGAVGRNTARGDSFVNLDLALTKAIRITERQILNFRAEFFNALNRANFGLPIGVIGAPGFGSAVETVNAARLIQFALKYSF